MSDIAHIKQCDDGRWLVQTIEEHCNGTAALAKRMANAFGAGEWARLCGHWHDIGKYSPLFQHHIISSSGYDSSVSDPGKVDHSTAGALFAKECLKGLSLPISYSICGHHRGLMDYGGNGRNSLAFHLSNQVQTLLEAVRPFITDTEPLPALPAPRFDNDTRTPKSWHLWIRMLFSCLVDADWLDTERFMEPEHYSMRGNFASLPNLKARLDTRLSRLSADAPPTAVNATRAEVQRQCRMASSLPQGIYSLTVPTGGGKTLSSLVWAMEHAIRHHLRRVIIAIPYTSIVTQTADTLRDIFGKENVVEHHSYVDFDDMPAREARRMKLATENWDAPVIVTTNAQLFESLYSNKTSRCRKLHNIAQSVLILDEVQMLSAENLQPLVDILGGLSKYMYTSILLTTATQPALSGKIGSQTAAFVGLQGKEIIPDKEKLFDKMRRVGIHFCKQPFTYKSLACQLSQYPQALCVVNTRGEAQRLYSTLPDKDYAFHLSRMMCQQHLSDKLKTIKCRLHNGEPVLVISTQLIEAGVDIDFPVVWREMAGLDSIAQSAGRCNREGRLRKGLVHVFEMEGAYLIGVMAKAADATRDLLDSGETDFLNPRVAEKYFHLFYAKLNDTDKHGVTDLLYRECPQFRSAAEAFHLIDDNTLTVYVPYGSGEALIERLIAGDYSSALLRSLQRYTVSIPPGRREEIERLGTIRLSDNVYALQDLSNYDDDTGLCFANRWLEDDLII